MTVYYDGPDAHITEERFESRSPSHRVFPIGDLRYVHAVPGSRRRPMELRALYRGSIVCLFSTRDRLVFGQVSRALLRVLERRDATPAGRS